MAWMVAIEGLILVKQIILRYEARINVAGLEINGVLSLVLDMRDLSPCHRAETAMEDEKLSMAKDHVTPLKERVAFWFAIESA